MATKPAPAKPAAQKPLTGAGLLARLVAEAFGTFVLVFSVIGTALFASGNTGYLGVAVAAGLAVLAAAYAVGHISGGHFNPAVTLGAAAAGRMPWRDVLPYIVAQILGGALATSALFFIGTGAANPDFGTFASNGYGELSAGGFSLVSVLLIEVILTALFLYVILSVTAPGATTAGFAPIAIGLALTVIHLVAIPVSNASVNPARSIATAIYGGGEPLMQLWVFLVAPAVGALIAGFTWKALFARS